MSELGDSRLSPQGAEDRESPALDLYRAAIAGADPAAATTAVMKSLTIERGRRVWIFAFGKAARPMATAAVDALLTSLHQIVGGVVVSPDAAPSPYPTLVAMRGDHPVPGRQSAAAARRIGEVAAGRRANDVALVLVSGGASSLIAGPLRGMSEADLSLLFELLLGSGLDISAMNAVRKRLTVWGAGRLALALAPATTHCMVVSDVIGDDISVVGCGPCVPDSTTVREVIDILKGVRVFEHISVTHRTHLMEAARGVIPETPKRTHPAFAHVSARVIATNRLALDACAHRARELGLAPEITPQPVSGDAAAAGMAIARSLLALRAQTPRGVGRCKLWGGETTVALGSRGGALPGAGGRCQELALAAAREFHAAGESAAGITLLAAGTDGRDGPTEAAGAVVDAGTWGRIVAAGRDPDNALRHHESHGALRAAGAIIQRSETGTNVADVVVGLVE